MFSHEEDVFYALGEGVKNILLVNFDIVIQSDQPIAVLKMHCVFQKYAPVYVRTIIKGVVEGHHTGGLVGEGDAVGLLEGDSLDHHHFES